MESSIDDVKGLHAKLDRKKKVEETNEVCHINFQEKFQGHIAQMQENLTLFVNAQKTYNASLVDKTCMSMIKGWIS